MEDLINNNEILSNRSNEQEDSKFGILDKIEILKGYKNNITETTFTLIRTSNDNQLNKISNKLLNSNSSDESKTIGLRVRYKNNMN